MRSEACPAKSEMSGSPVRGTIFVAGNSAITETLRRREILSGTIQLNPGGTGNLPGLAGYQPARNQRQHVAQICNLPYRGFVTRLAPRDFQPLADWKSAEQQSATLRYDGATASHCRAGKKHDLSTKIPLLTELEENPL